MNTHDIIRQGERFLRMASTAETAEESQEWMDRLDAWVREDVAGRFLVLDYVQGKAKAEAAFHDEQARVYLEMKRKAEATETRMKELKLSLLRLASDAGEPFLRLPDGRFAKVQTRVTKVVEVVDIDAVPRDLLRVEVKRTDVKTLLEAGSMVPGCKMGESVSEWAAIVKTAPKVQR